MEEKNMCSEGKQVILAQVLRLGPKSVFYVIDLDADRVCKTPVSTLLNGIRSGGLVQLGSLIYIVGDDPDEYSNLKDEHSDLKDGDHHLYTGASCLELSKPHLISLLEEEEEEEEDAHCDYDSSGSMRWKNIPAMNYDRENPACASLGGKIYALGGSPSIGEVFTPESGEWKSLVSPPSDILLTHVSLPLIPDGKNVRLLVHFTSAHALYAYYPANGKWDCLDDQYWQWHRATALVDGVLYSHVERTLDCLVAYDLATKSLLNVVYSPNFPWEVCISAFENMFHLGSDILCLANSCFIAQLNVEVQHSYLQFNRFRVKRTTPTEVLVTPIGVNIFRFENYLRGINFIAL